jgi:aspartate aminotransferase
VYPRSPIPDDQRFVQRLAERGVLVLPSALFHHSGHVRLSLTASDEMIERALPEFRRAITLRCAS